MAVVGVVIAFNLNVGHVKLFSWTTVQPKFQS